ncbi:MAG: hypothetical protein RRZ24_01430 [Clostridia bacterium]
MGERERTAMENGPEKKKNQSVDGYTGQALTLIDNALDNHEWRQECCINLIPSEMTQSRAVRLLCSSDPSFRYAEHKTIHNHEVFYYQGTGFIGKVEEQVVAELKRFLGCTQVEARALSGQMANAATFSALMNLKNSSNRTVEAKRLGYVLNNHIIRGGHLSAQPMGALHDCIAIDPATKKPAVVNFPVCADNLFKVDVEATKELIDRYRPELIIFGKSMVLHREPVAEIAGFLKEQNLNAVIMYDMAHVLGLVGDYFQKPFAEGADIVTGSTHKTFFGPQRGVIAVNTENNEQNAALFASVQSRVFPGSVSNHHLGTLLGLLMATYEMNCFKEAYQKNVIHNAKHFAKALKSEGVNVAGDEKISYTETHQVIIKVGSGAGMEIAERMEQNNIIVNHQATPDETGFNAAGALRTGVAEMTRFGFGDAEFEKLASLMADVILRNRDVTAEVKKLRSGFTTLRYCFDDQQTSKALDCFAQRIGL